MMNMLNVTGKDILENMGRVVEKAIDAGVTRKEIECSSNVERIKIVTERDKYVTTALVCGVLGITGMVCSTVKKLKKRSVEDTYMEGDCYEE